MMQEIMTRRCEAGRIEKFPYIPEKFLYKIKSDGKNKDKPDSGVVQQMDIIKSLMERSDVEGIISATDDDTEKGRSSQMKLLITFPHKSR